MVCDGSNRAKYCFTRYEILQDCPYNQRNASQALLSERPLPWSKTLVVAFCSTISDTDAVPPKRSLVSIIHLRPVIYQFNLILEQAAHRPVRAIGTAQKDGRPFIRPTQLYIPEQQPGIVAFGTSLRCLGPCFNVFRIDSSNLASLLLKGGRERVRPGHGLDSRRPVVYESISPLLLRVVGPHSCSNQYTAGK